MYSVSRKITKQEIVVHVHLISNPGINSQLLRHFLFLFFVFKIVFSLRKHYINFFWDDFDILILKINNKNHHFNIFSNEKHFKNTMQCNTKHIYIRKAIMMLKIRLGV
jgi:hypothetical protein